MKKKSVLERIRYRLDRMMSRGPISMSLLLFAVTAALVAVIGIVAYFVSGEGSVVYQIWNSLMHTLDAGNLAGVPADNILYLILMFLATLCGLFLTSVLVGIIATGVEGKLRDLRKGTSVVQEESHTVVVGFDNNVYDLLRELIEANANKKKGAIVVLGVQPKEEMEELLASHIPDRKTTQIICRSGSLHETYALERCAVEAAKSVIINVTDDAETVKVLLALSAYLKGKTLVHEDLRFVASLRDGQYVEAATIAGEGRAEIIFAKDAIARIISNTCRQHGLSQVLTELFNFSGNEFYFEKIPQLTGKTFHEAMLCFSNAIVAGLCTDGEVRLNPPMDSIIGENDSLILLEEDDGSYDYHPAKRGDPTAIRSGESISAHANDNLIVLGSNDKLPIVLHEYDKYMAGDSRVILVDDNPDEESLGSFVHLNITICRETVTRKLLCELLTEDSNNILLLNDDSLDSESADSQTLLRLILLRDIADKSGRQFAITTEMRSVDNQRLASQARVDDFVIGSNFASLLMAQISEDPNMMPVVEDLLDESGSELYMKPAVHYVKPGVAVDSYTLTESAARKGEIYLGYRHMTKVKSNVVVNPPKDQKVVFGIHDQLVVIAEN